MTGIIPGVDETLIYAKASNGAQWVGGHFWLVRKDYINKEVGESTVDKIVAGDFEISLGQVEHDGKPILVRAATGDLLRVYERIETERQKVYLNDTYVSTVIRLMRDGRLGDHRPVHLRQDKDPLKPVGIFIPESDVIVGVIMPVRFV